MNVRAKAVAGLWWLLLAVSGAVFAQARGPAPEATWPAVLEAARKEGSVVLYSQQVPPVLARIQADFAAQYPAIKLEIQRLSGQGVISKLDQERLAAADGGDVAITVEIPWLEERAKEGSLRKPAGPSSRGWPARYMVMDTFPIVGLEPVVMAYNTNLVKGPVTGYQDLLRPEFKGKIGTTVPRGLATVAWWDWVEKSQGADFMQKLAAQQPKLYQGVVPNAQAVAAGEISVSMYVIASVAKPLQAQGAPIELVIPKPSLGFNFVGAAMGWSKRPNAALVFMDYMMSPRGQAAWNGGRGEAASPLPGIVGSMDASTINLYDSRQFPGPVVDAHTERLNKLFAGQ